MQTKLFALLFIAAVLASSFAASVLPVANALTVRTDFSDRHTTASWGNSRVCGDHICKSGEQTAWMNKMAELQRVGYGKIGNATNYEQALKHIESNSTMTANGNVTTGHPMMGTMAKNNTKCVNPPGGPAIC